ncbi:MAG TPA: GNAT family N-acetyltransferase [Chloroflexota bacterium]
MAQSSSIRSNAYMSSVPPCMDREQPLERQLHSIHFRPVRPDDWRKLQRFHKRLSPETVERRFHAAKRELSEPLAHTFTQIDGVNDAAVVATTGTRGRIIGVARYCRMTSTCAEVAFVVEDAYQGHGIGRRLMRHLRDLALQNGVTEFLAYVLSGNVPMFHLLEEVGTTHTHFDRGECEVLVDLMNRP